jgi:hypothetical protein
LQTVFTFGPHQRRRQHQLHLTLQSFIRSKEAAETSSSRASLETRGQYGLWTCPSIVFTFERRDSEIQFRRQIHPAVGSNVIQINEGDELPSEHKININEGNGLQPEHQRQSGLSNVSSEIVLAAPNASLISAFLITAFVGANKETRTFSRQQLQAVSTLGGVKDDANLITHFNRLHVQEKRQ